jgi:hypothetical protein
MGVEFNRRGGKGRAMVVEGARKRVVQLLQEMMMVCFDFCLSKTEIIGVNVSHMTEHVLEKDLVLIKFNAVNILYVDP